MKIILDIADSVLKNMLSGIVISVFGNTEYTSTAMQYENDDVMLFEDGTIMIFE